MSLIKDLTTATGVAYNPIVRANKGSDPEGHDKEMEGMESISINVRGYGSLQNAIGNQTKSLKPEIGMGATEICYSDRHPYTVVAILGDKKIQVQADCSKRTDNAGYSESQQYDYTPNTEAPILTLRLNKFGRWKVAGEPDGWTYLIGRREEHYDFTR